MPLVVERYAGLDVDQPSVVACVLIGVAGRGGRPAHASNDARSRESVIAQVESLVRRGLESTLRAKIGIDVLCSHIGTAPPTVVRCISRRCGKS